ncbi:MAG: PAS domain S-box protein [Sedimentisphaerales bacterium]|nr:PAS domain S-box protein [Sedimentisphaerales bacterium]
MKEKVENQHDMVVSIEKMRRRIMELERTMAHLKTKEKILKEGDNHFREIAENIQEVFWICSPDWEKIFYISPAYEKIWGFSCESLYKNGRSWLEAVVEEDRDRLKKDLARKVAGDLSEVDFPKYRIRCPNGTLRWIQARAFPIHNEEGQVYRMAGIAEDITMRKIAEDNAIYQEQYFRSILQNLHEDILVIDRDYRITDLNHGIFAMTGQERDQVIGRCCYDVLHGYTEPCVHLGVECQLHEVFQTGEPASCQHRYIREDGMVCYVDKLLSPIKSEDGRVVRVIEALRDITQFKKNEEQIRLTQFAIDHTSDAAFWIGSDSRFVYINEAAVKTLGYSREELLGMKVSDIDPIFTEEDWPGHWDELKRKSSITVESMHRKKDGRMFPVEVVANYIKYEDREYNCAIVRDITERKDSERKLKESETRLRELFQNISSGVAVYEVVDEGRDFIFRDFNRAGEKIDSAKKEDIMGRRVTEVFPGVETFGLLEVFCRVWQTGTPQHHPITLYKDKRISGWRENYVYKLPTGEIVAVYDDITERKKAEESLRASEEHFRLFYERSPLGYQSLDENGCFIEVNPAWCNLMGYSYDEVIGLWFGDFLVLSEKDIFRERILRFKAAGEIRGVQFELIRKDGSHIIVEIDGKVSYDEQGNFQQSHCVLRDITSRKQAEKEIEDLAKFPSEDPSPVMRINREGKLLYGNEASKSLIDQWDCSERESVPDEWRQIASEVFAEGRVKRIEMKYDSRIFSFYVVPVVDSGYVNLYGHDVTERKKIEEKLIRHREQLSSLVSQLASSEEQERKRIATELHDRIGQSLVLAKMKMDMYEPSGSEEDFEKFRKEISETLGKVINQTQSMTYDLGTPTLYDLGLASAIREWLIEEMEYKYGIATHFEEDGIDNKLDNKTRVFLFRAVRELLINVVKHARARHVRVSVQRDDFNITLCVSDDGIGYDVQQVTVSRQKGSGFGLFSIKERIKYMGGRMDIQSQPGKGTQVRLVYPISDSI